MPSYDSSRARFRLAGRHISVFGQLMDGETPPEELFPSLGELQQIGLVGQEGEIAPVLRDLLTTLADPMVMIQVEVTGEHGPVNHGLVVGRETVVAHDGWPGEEESEYLAIEPGTLVWELARKVNLRSSETVEPPVRRIETTMGALDAALTALGQAAPDADITQGADIARKALAEVGGPAEPALSLFADLTLALNSTWRVTTVVGRHPSGRTRRRLNLRARAVWDLSPLGSLDPRECPKSRSSRAALAPTTSSAPDPHDGGRGRERLADLLPDKAELMGEE